MHFPTPRSLDSVIKQTSAKRQSEVTNQELAHPLQSVKNGDTNPHGKISNGKNISKNKQYCQFVRLEVVPHGVGTTLANSSPNVRKQGRTVKTEHWKFVRPGPVLLDQCVKWPELPGPPVCEFAGERLNGESCLPFHRFRGFDITCFFYCNLANSVVEDTITHIGARR